MPDTNTEPFLQAFARIEKSLRLFSGSMSRAADSFYAMVATASVSNAAVRRHANDLREIADLRNAIVHERWDGHPIAEPYSATVEWATGLAEQLENPSRLITVLGRTVIQCAPQDSVGLAARQMYDGNFSQLPVYQGPTFVALLTAETVARWLGSALASGVGLIEEVTVSDVLPYAETDDNVQFLGERATAYEALDLFDRYEQKGRTLDAILISHDARREVRPLAIATIYEVPKLIGLTRAR